MMSQNSFLNIKEIGKVLFIGLLVAGATSLFIGNTGGFLVATLAGTALCRPGRRLVGAFLGMESAEVGWLLEGSRVLPPLYWLATVVAAVCFVQSVHTTWKEGIAYADAAYEALRKGTIPETDPSLVSRENAETPVTSEAVG